MSSRCFPFPTETGGYERGETFVPGRPLWNERGGIWGVSRSWDQALRYDRGVRAMTSDGCLQVGIVHVRSVSPPVLGRVNHVSGHSPPPGRGRDSWRKEDLTAKVDRPDEFTTTSQLEERTLCSRFTFEGKERGAEPIAQTVCVPRKGHVGGSTSYRQHRIGSSSTIGTEEDGHVGGLVVRPYRLHVICFGTIDIFFICYLLHL